MAKGPRGGKRAAKTMTLDAYLGKQGLSMPVSSYMLDKVKLPHGATKRQMDKLNKDAAKAENDYQAKRNAAIKEYNKLVDSGKIRKPTMIEEALDAAKGMDELPATQAARRALEKRGIDWKTGKKIK